ncbi:hypothetical protein BU14_0364s0007 [Porphyra umbilicalis]|uniref:Uncharacterized protein n=1 Tax=Porphyra umbilicalis TaxID=2786 RepID=A0A1X6NXZ8_PORUM|nr:hypothetical protein BU14_0364s0007 [Porphyra umbilicalis]|eukprot:OSX73253.1 hypothetical protein BU14_0364s0007 [Porphyra umbilicalis]
MHVMVAAGSRRSPLLLLQQRLDEAPKEALDGRPVVLGGCRHRHGRRLREHRRVGHEQLDRHLGRGARLLIAHLGVRLLDRALLGARKVLQLVDKALPVVEKLGRRRPRVGRPTGGGAGEVARNVHAHLPGARGLHEHRLELVHHVADKGRPAALRRRRLANGRQRVVRLLDRRRGHVCSGVGRRDGGQGEGDGGDQGRGEATHRGGGVGGEGKASKGRVEPGEERVRVHRWSAGGVGGRHGCAGGDGGGKPRQRGAGSPKYRSPPPTPPTRRGGPHARTPPTRGAARPCHAPRRAPATHRRGQGQCAQRQTPSGAGAAARRRHRWPPRAPAPDASVAHPHTGEPRRVAQPRPPDDTSREVFHGKAPPPPHRPPWPANGAAARPAGQHRAPTPHHPHQAQYRGGGADRMTACVRGGTGTARRRDGPRAPIADSRGVHTDKTPAGACKGAVAAARRRRGRAPACGRRRQRQLRRGCHQREAGKPTAGEPPSDASPGGVIRTHRAIEADSEDAPIRPYNSEICMQKRKTKPDPVRRGHKDASQGVGVSEGAFFIFFDDIQ